LRWRFRFWLERWTGFPRLAKGETDYGARVLRGRFRRFLRARERGYATPDQAATGDIPPHFARVSGVKYSKAGDRACVWLLTNDEPSVYPCTVYCSRDEHGFWYSDSGWSGHTDASLVDLPSSEGDTRCRICGEPVDHDSRAVTFVHEARYGFTGRYSDIPGWIKENYVVHSQCREAQQAGIRGPILRE
jgi:hypothetical protein